MSAFWFAIFLLILIEGQNVCNAESDIEHFFRGITADLRDAVKSLWTKIRKPFAIKRLGRGGRRLRRSKSTTVSTSISTSTEISTPTVADALDQQFRRVPIPILTSPEWRDIDQWKLSQIPRHVFSPGPSYEFRRRQISKWVDRYIVPRTTKYFEYDVTTSPAESSTIISYTDVETPQQADYYLYSNAIN